MTSDDAVMSLKTKSSHSAIFSNVNGDWLVEANESTTVIFHAFAIPVKIDLTTSVVRMDWGLSAGKLGVRVIVRAGVVCRRLHVSEVCYAVSRMSTPSMMTHLLHQRGVVAPHSIA